MQIQARASRGVKSRRVGGGSNFHETFPRMNEGRRVGRLRVLGESLPIVDTFIFVVPLLRDFPLSSPPIPRRQPRLLFHTLLSLFPYRSSPSRECITTFLWEELVASRSRYPVTPSSSRDLISAYRKEVFLKFSKYSSRRVFSSSRGGESRESSSRKCNSTVDYTRKIALDGPSTDVSAECMHSKCIGSRTHTRFLRACQNVHYRKEKRRAVILDHH